MYQIAVYERYTVHRRKDRAQGAQAVDSVRCGGCGYGFGDSPVVAYTADAKIKR